MSELLWPAFKRVMGQWALLVCAGLLIVSAIGLRVAAEKLELYLQKEAIPLRKSLDDLDESRLGPYRVVNKSKISNPEVEASLGTKDYIQWHIEDTRAQSGDPARNLILFVTYYTGNPDKVPHIPERCYVGGGGNVDKNEDVTITVPGSAMIDGAGDGVPLRVLDMEVPGGMTGRQRQIVTYFFAVNGTYMTSRNKVRVRLHLPTERYAYFSKVEVTFAGDRPPARDKAIEAVEELCQVVLPLLVSEHWPDWNNLDEAQADN